jgi:membrane-associated phospholipid phosphatase
MGMGTAAQRVMTRAHYLSDTVLAACVAFACAWLWWRLQWRVWRARRGAHGIG